MVWPWPVVWNVEAGVAEAFDTGTDRRRLNGKEMEPYKGFKRLVRDYSKCKEWDLLSSSIP